MSKVGSQPNQVHNNPIYNERTANNPLFKPSSAEKMGKTADFNGSTFTKEATAEPRAQEGGIGSKIASFFSKIGDGFAWLGNKIAGAFTRAPQAEAPATAVTAETVKPQSEPVEGSSSGASAPAIKPLTSEMLFGSLDAKGSVVEKAIKPAQLSEADRFAGSYAYVKNAANEAVSDPTTFMRSNNNGAALTSLAGNQPESKDILDSLRDVFGDSEVAISNKAFGINLQKVMNDKTKQYDITIAYDAKLSDFPSMQKKDGDSAEYKTAKSKLIEQSLDIVDRCMCKAFGKPGDAASIEEAAARLPQSLCDQIAVLHKAIDDSNVSDELKGKLKLHAARDAVALRTILPIGTKIANDIDEVESKRIFAENKNKPLDQQVQFKRSIPAASMVEVSKVMQSLVNGVGVGTKDTDLDVQEAGGDLQDRWNASFADFMNAAVARADPAVVAAAARDGAAFAKPQPNI